MHVSRVCKSKKSKETNPTEKNECIKNIEKDEIKQEMRKIWRKKKDLETNDEFVPSSGMDDLFGN